MNYVQIVDKGKQSPHRIKCMTSLRERVTNYRVIETPFSENVFDMVMESDKIRLKLAMEDPDLCYVDTDCFISAPLDSFEMDISLPMFGKRETEAGCHPDIFYFYVNGNCEYFKNNLNSNLLKDGVYSLPIESLTGLRGFEYIPDQSYYHNFTTITKVVSDSKQNQDGAYIKKLAILRRHIELMAMAING